MTTRQHVLFVAIFSVETVIALWFDRPLILVICLAFAAWHLAAL